MDAKDWLPAIIASAIGSVPGIIALYLTVVHRRQDRTPSIRASLNLHEDQSGRATQLPVVNDGPVTLHEVEVVLVLGLRDPPARGREARQHGRATVQMIEDRYPFTVNERGPLAPGHRRVYEFRTDSELAEQLKASRPEDVGIEIRCTKGILKRFVGDEVLPFVSCVDRLHPHWAAQAAKMGQHSVFGAAVKKGRGGGIFQTPSQSHPQDGPDAP